MDERKEKKNAKRGLKKDAKDAELWRKIEGLLCIVKTF